MLRLLTRFTRHADRTRVEAMPPIKPHQIERAKRGMEAHVLVGIEHVTVLGH